MMASTDTERYVRTTLLTFEGGIWISQKILYRELDRAPESPTISAMLHSNESSLSSDLSRRQFQIVFPTSGAPTQVDDWNLPLLVKIVQTLFGDSLTDRESGDLQELVHIRNEVACHGSQPAINENKFFDYWSRLTGSINRLAFDTETKEHVFDLTANLVQGPLDIQSSVDRLAELCRNDEDMEEVLADLYRHVREQKHIATGVTSANAKLDDVLLGIKTLLNISHRDNDQCKVEIPILNSEVRVTGDEEEEVKLAEDILSTVLKAAVSKVDDPSDAEKVKSAVKQFLGELEVKEAAAVSTDKGSIILNIKCLTLLGLDNMISLFQMYTNRYRLVEIENALNNWLGEGHIQVHLVLPEGAVEKISAFIDECFKAISEALKDTEVTRGLNLGIQCQSLESVQRVLEYFRSEASTNRMNQLSEALSEAVNGTVKVTMQVDEQGFLNALRAAGMPSLTTENTQPSSSSPEPSDTDLSRDTGQPIASLQAPLSDTPDTQETSEAPESESGADLHGPATVSQEAQQPTDSLKMMSLGDNPETPESESGADLHGPATVSGEAQQPTDSLKTTSLDDDPETLESESGADLRGPATVSGDVQLIDSLKTTSLDDDPETPESESGADLHEPATVSREAQQPTDSLKTMSLDDKPETPESESDLHGPATVSRDAGQSTEADPLYRRVILSCYIEIIQELEPETLLDMMVQRNYLPLETLSDLVSLGRVDMIRRIIDRVIAKGPDGYQVFLDMLRELDNAFLYSMLKEKEKELKKEDEVEFAGSDAKSVMRKDVPFDDADEYDFSHERRGMMLIFYNEYFKTHSAFPDSTLHAAEYLRHTFKKLGFAVRLYRNLTRDEMLHKFKQAAKENHSNADCFACAILSPGPSFREKEDLVYAVDEAILTTEITTMFSDSNCPTLKGKPRLFFVEDCRGDKFDLGVHMCVSSHEVDKVPTVDSDFVPMSPLYKDFLMVYATTPGHYAFGRSDTGSWFVDVLCDVFSRPSVHDKGLITLLTEVNRLVYQMDKTTKLMIANRLVKDIYFRTKPQDSSVVKKV